MDGDAHLNKPTPNEPRRYSQHVKSCKSCRSAVTWIERLQAACTALAAVAAPIGVWTLLLQAAARTALGQQAAVVPAAAGALGAVLGWPMILVAAAALFARHKLQGLWRKFHFTDYVHADVE